MAETTAAPEQPRVTFARAPVAGLDRLLPARTGPFLAAVLGFSALVWSAGWILADERGSLLGSAEWWAGVPYLALHLLLLRLFVSAYAGNFLVGCRALDIGEAEVHRRLRRVLGPISILGALAVTVPLVVLDMEYVRGEEYLGKGLALGRGHVLGPADILLVVVWSLEWVINAYIWLVIVASLVLTLRVLNRYAFRDPIERVLREQQYRPFLLMNAQGATLTLLLAGGTIAYIKLADGATSDLIGLWVTGGLVVLGFVPPYLMLKSRLGAVVREEAKRLGASLDQSTEALGTGAREPAATVEALGTRLDLVLDMVRVDHLTRLHDALGKNEAQGMVIKLLVPAATGGWRFLKTILGIPG